MKKRNVPKYMPKHNFISLPKSLIRAKLCHHQFDVSKRWFIDIVILDSITQQPVRKRISKQINRFTTAVERQIYAEDFIRRLVSLVASGATFTAKTKFDQLEIESGQTDYSKISLQEAFEVFIQHKADISYKETNRYKATLRYLAEFEQKHKPIQLSKVTHHQIKAFLTHLLHERKLEAKTYNHYRSVYFAVFNHFFKLGVISSNPVAMVPSLRVQKGKRHKPLTIAQVAAMRDLAVQKGDYQFVLFISMGFYALIRPGRELRLMRVRDIGPEFIFVTSENAKSFESRRVEMVTPLKKLINASKIQDYPGDYFLFSRDGNPGSEPVGGGYFYKKQKRYLKELGLHDQGHDLYCYKHSGAIQMIKDGYTAMDIQLMAGHKSPTQTMDYLYNIGAISRLGEKVNWMTEF
jgi:integrase